MCRIHRYLLARFTVKPGLLAYPAYAAQGAATQCSQCPLGLWADSLPPERGDCAGFSLVLTFNHTKADPLSRTSGARWQGHEWLGQSFDSDGLRATKGLGQKA